MNLETNASEWLAYAQADLTAAQHLLESGDHRACAVFCHQALEKLLKAIIVAETRQRPPYWHGLRLLMEHIQTIEVPEDIARKASEIEPHYIGARYPGVIDRDYYTRERCQRWFEQTTEVFTWFLSQLNEISRSEDS